MSGRPWQIDPECGHKEMQSGIVFNIQRYSIQDGPGIRTTVFLKGCPLRCGWCHNPEGQSPVPQVMLVETRCIGCGRCSAVCPLSECAVGLRPAQVLHGQCKVCGRCVEVCPTGARQIVGRRMSTMEVMFELAKDEVFYVESGGGVTFSGGEPVAQPEFLRDLLVSCRARGLHTAIDTCGYGSTGTVVELGQLADLILFDIKLIDDKAHCRYTGVSNSQILTNLHALDKVHQNLWLRVPLIPGITDTPDNLEATAELVTRLHNVRKITILPYHKVGLQKFRRIGMESPLPTIEPPTEEQLAAAAAVFKSAGLPVAIGG